MRAHRRRAWDGAAARRAARRRLAATTRPALSRAPEARATRERLGCEAPGAVLGGPPISVTCECGVKHDLAYGEAWTCERCGRRWDTKQIPREQYEVVRRTQLRFRVLPVALGLLVARRSRSSSRSPQHLQRLLPAAGRAERVVRLPAAVPPPALPRGDRRAAAVGAAPGVGGPVAAPPREPSGWRTARRACRAVEAARARDRALSCPARGPRRAVRARRRPPLPIETRVRRGYRGRSSCSSVL